MIVYYPWLDLVATAFFSAFILLVSEQIKRRKSRENFLAVVC